MRGAGLLLTRVFILIYVAFILLMCAFGWFVYRMAADSVETQMANKCVGIAVAAATMLEQDPEGYKRFAETLDTSSAYYRRAKRSMEKIRAGNEDNIVFIYTEKRISDTEMMFILDGEPENAKFFSPPGTTDALTPARLAAYTDEARTKGSFVTTGYGTLLSAYAPITNQETGEFLGLAGVDVSSRQYDAMMRFSATLIAASIGGMLFMVALLLLLSSKRIARHIAVDSLTSAYNKPFFLRSLKQRVKLSEKCGEPLLVVMADLDNFKAVNDTHGHLFGDVVLAEISKAIRATLRESDCFARYGGDEFSAYFPGLRRESAAAVLERIRKAVADLRIDNPEHGTQAGITISIGATCLRPGQTPAEVLDESDKALYEAKKTRNAVVFREEYPTPAAS